MNLEKKKVFIINALYIFTIAIIIYFVLNYALYWLMPFILGFMVAFVLKPLINKISGKTNVNRKIVAAVSVLIFYSLIIFLSVALGAKIILSITELATAFPAFYTDTIQPAFENLFISFEDSLSLLNPGAIEGVQGFISNLSSDIGAIISKASISIVTYLSSGIASIPSIFIRILITIIASFFIAMDYYKITGFCLRQLSDKGKEIALEVKEYMVGTVFKYIKSYAIILTITFIELAIGLTIFRVENSIIIALIIASFDILPIVGTGTILIPWAIIDLVLGKPLLPFLLLGLYFSVAIIRNFLEPKIVGGEVGLHPVVALISIFLGAKFLGFFGIFILPITVVILKNLNDTGRIHIFK